MIMLEGEDAGETEGLIMQQLEQPQQPQQQVVSSSLRLGFVGGDANESSTSSTLGMEESTMKTRLIEPFEMEDAYNEKDNDNDNGNVNDNDNDFLALLTGSSDGTRAGHGSGHGSVVVVKLEFQRWIQLAYLSLLAMMSDWICFSVAASAETFEELFVTNAASTSSSSSYTYTYTYTTPSSTRLIDWFLCMNVLSCFVVTDCVSRYYGLQRCIRGSATLMAVGVVLRFVAFPWSYPLFVTGTLLVGAAQPFFQCTPPLLSALWFGADERATSTAVALNFNQIGIATAFLVGGPLGTTERGLRVYFGLMAACATLLALGTWRHFEARPATPPSLSEWSKHMGANPTHHHQEPPFHRSARQLLLNSGFRKALSAFICSIAITNVVGALIEEILHRGGVTETWQVAVAGGVFELTIVLGGIVLGGYVDRSKQYKQVTIACLLLSILFVIPLGLEWDWDWNYTASSSTPTSSSLSLSATNEHSTSNNSASSVQKWIVVISMALLGFVTGPVQPINAELAVDVTYPEGDETAVESVQQIGGNLVSALLMPCAEWASSWTSTSSSSSSPLAVSLGPLGRWLGLRHVHVQGDVLLLVAVTVGTLLNFCTFASPLRRTLADTKTHTRDRGIRSNL